MAFYIAATGHRPPKVGGYKYSPMQQWVRNHLSAHLNARHQAYGGQLRVLSGMALGVDQWWAQEAFALGIRVVACIPFPSQPATWPEAAQNFYQQLLGQCYDIVYVNQDPYAAWKLHARNRYMVDRCSELVAVWDGNQQGGTWRCLEYAMAQAKPYHRYFPSQAAQALWTQQAAAAQAAADAGVVEDDGPQDDGLVFTPPAIAPQWGFQDTDHVTVPQVVLSGPAGTAALPPELHTYVQQAMANYGDLTVGINAAALQNDLNNYLLHNWPGWSCHIPAVEPALPTFMDQPAAHPDEQVPLNPIDELPEPF